MKKLEHNVKVHIHKITPNTPFSPHTSCFQMSSPASVAQSQNEQSHESVSSLISQLHHWRPMWFQHAPSGCPTLILLNQANTPTQNHKIKLQILADVQQSFSSHSHLPYDPGLSELALINPVLNTLLSLCLSYTPG